MDEGSMNIYAYTSICEEDRVWIPQYLAEAERIGVPFCVYFDRCSPDTRKALISHRLCYGSICKLGSAEFVETDKQDVFDLTREIGADWAMAWDVDETWCPDFAEQVERLDPATMDYVDCPWLNLWEDAGHVRIDGPFSEGHRVKFYNLRCGEQWTFRSAVVNGPSGPSTLRLAKLPVTCVHHGLMTHELRVQHKERWDRIYEAAVGANPYGIWNYSLAYEDYPPVTCTLAERLEKYRVY